MDWHPHAEQLCAMALPQLRPRLVQAMARIAGGPGVIDALADESRALTIYSLMCRVEQFVDGMSAEGFEAEEVVSACVDHVVENIDELSLEIIAETTVMEVVGSRPPRSEMH